MTKLNILFTFVMLNALNYLAKRCKNIGIIINLNHI